MERESFMDSGADWQPNSADVSDSGDLVGDLPVGTGSDLPSDDNGEITGDLPEGTGADLPPDESGETTLVLPEGVGGDLLTDDTDEVIGDLPEGTGGDMPPDDYGEITRDLPAETAVERAESQPLPFIERFENEKDVSAPEVKTDHDLYKLESTESDESQPKMQDAGDAAAKNNKEEDAALESVLKDASDEEKALYASYPLEAGETDGRSALKREDLNPLTLDENEECNLDFMQDGKAPKLDGESVELHHIGQTMDAPLAELTRAEHRGAGVDSILHDKTQPSEIDRDMFGDERKHFWKARTQEILEKEIAEADKKEG